MTKGRSGNWKTEKGVGYIFPGDKEIKGTTPDSARRIRVGITYNLKKYIITDPPDAEAEYDDFDTILAIKNALETGDLDVELFEATEDLPAKLIEHKPDLVFNIAEGISGRGREAQIPAILNYLHIPFTGSDETTMCIAMDKALTKRLLASYNIRTPKYKVITRDTRFSAGNLCLPVIVKPYAEGSSKGLSYLSVTSDAAELRMVIEKNIEMYKQDMLVEEYIPGREFTVGLLGNDDEIHVFPPMEIIFLDKENSVYNYEVKKNFRQCVKYECPPNICPSIRANIEKTAEKIYRILKCRDCARIDFRLSPEGRLYFIEINPLPGLAPGYSDFPILAEFCGVDYNSLIRGILDRALARYRINNQ